MIKKLFVLCLLFFCARHSTAQVQREQFEASGGVGLVSMKYIGDQFGGDKAPEYFNSESPIISASGKYFFSDWCGIGLTLAYVSMSGTSAAYNNPYSYSFKQHLVCIAPEVEPIYYKSNFFQFYGVYGIGIYNYTQVEDMYDGSKRRINGGLLTMQLSPCAFRVGGRLAGYVELGIGYKGLINGGISYAIGEGRPTLLRHPIGPRHPMPHRRRFRSNTYSPFQP